MLNNNSQVVDNLLVFEVQLGVAVFHLEHRLPTFIDRGQPGLLSVYLLEILLCLLVEVVGLLEVVPELPQV